MAADTLFHRITDYAHRADPYPLYAELRENGVARQDDGSYLVGTYHDIAALLHDPRISSDRRHRTVPDGAAGTDEGVPPSFIGLDDPEHHRLRGLAMRSFGPPHTPDRIDGMHEDITRIVRDLIAGFEGKERIDVVDDFAYPLPVTVICRLLGVPTEDEPRFRLWSDAIVAGFDPTPGTTPRSGSARAPTPGSRWRCTWASSPRGAVATPPATCSPPSSTTRAPRDSSPRWRPWPPPSCCSSPAMRRPST